MKTLRRLALAGLSALTLAAFLQFTTGCRPKNGQADAQSNEVVKFTGKLTELEGVQVLYTLRHPKLINQEIETLMKEIPEAALARMFMGNLAAFGYPEFSELAANTNIGVAMLDLTESEIQRGKPTFVGFAKLKEGGKIWSFLTQAGLAFQKEGEWILISQDPASFAKIKAPASIIAQIEQPQDEEIRVWGRVSPELLATAKQKLLPQLDTQLDSRTPEEKKAILAYVDVLWGYLAQLHSGGAALDLDDQGISIGYHGQFLPDSATGRFFRRDLGASPKIAESLPADGMMSALMRQNMPGQIEFVNGLLDALIAVDYAPGTSALQAIKNTYAELAKNNHGGAAISMSMGMPAEGKQPEVDMFGVYTGAFTDEQISKAYKETLALSKKFTGIALEAATSLSPGTPAPAVEQTLKENALTIDGIPFGTISTTTKITVSGKEQITTTTQYYGVVGGNLVIASNETSLRAKLPALVARSKVDNAIKLTLKDDEMIALAVHGENIVDAVLGSLELDLNDADIQAQIKSIKEGYLATDPVKTTLNTSQAKASVVTSIPYKFIAQSIRLGQFASAYKNTAQMAPAAPTPALAQPE
jgi:hypothetical protein